MVKCPDWFLLIFTSRISDKVLLTFPSLTIEIFLNQTTDSVTTITTYYDWNEVKQTSVDFSDKVKWFIGGLFRIGLFLLMPISNYLSKRQDCVEFRMWDIFRQPPADSQCYIWNVFWSSQHIWSDLHICGEGHSAFKQLHMLSQMVYRCKSETRSFIKPDAQNQERKH